MKKLLSVLLLISSLFGQDVLTLLNGAKYSGQLLEEQPRHILFKPESQKNPQRLPIKTIKCTSHSVKQLLEKLTRHSPSRSHHSHLSSLSIP